MSFFELREYRTKPGQRENWVRFMEEEVIPYQISKGMVVVGSFVGEQEDDLYIWIRRFDSEEQRQELYEAVYQSDYWVEVLSPQVPEMMDRERIVVRRIEPTDKSVLR